MENTKLYITTLLKEVLSIYRTKKFLHVINAGFALGMAVVYFESFIFTFGDKEVDLEMAHSVVMIKILIVGMIILRGLTYALEKSQKTDELDRIIRRDTAQVAYICLVLMIIGSLLSWSIHESTRLVFHFVFLSCIISYGLFHFINLIKRMNFMTKPSLFEFDVQED